MDQVDLKTLSARESDQVEWKENVADTDSVRETLAAFAYDWSNLAPRASDKRSNVARPAR